MLDSQSRYAGLQTGEIDVTQSDGQVRSVPYLRRRIMDPAQSQITLVEHTVTQGDRLDNITARYLGDPTQFWRICDANRVLDPAELTGDIGRIIRITVPRI